ncbi:MAG: TetR/AcrR family transcriptional regulator [bacterium]|jgi:AcrR family transcriptional regulator
MDVKQRIIEQARALFFRLGIRSVSMDDIASHMGISKKTIYQHFTDKDELVESIVLAETNRMQNDCINLCNTAENAVHEIFKTMEMVVEQFRNINSIVLFDMQKFHFNAFKRFMEYRNNFLINIIANNLEKGVKEGNYRPDINIDVLSKFRLESMMLAFNLEAFPPDKYNAAEVTLIMIENFLYGVSTEKGFNKIEAYKKERNNKWIIN